MLGEGFRALLITSLAGTCLAAVLAIAKPITKKIFGYAWHYYIWLAVLVVMLLPVRFHLPSRVDTAPVAMRTAQTTQTIQTAQPAENTDTAIPTAQTEPKTDVLQTGASFVKSVIDNRLNLFAYLWLTGALLLLLAHLIGYIGLIAKMRKNSVVVPCPALAGFTRRNVTVRVWANTSSPFMIGLLKPTLVLPARELAEEQLNHILRHEMTHFKRHDILYKWFVSFVKCLHWFNPVIWYVAKQINTECEISCDMAAVQNMSRSEEMSYIDTVLALLPMGKTRQIPLTTQMASSKKILKRRFEMIRNKKKTSKMMSVISAIIATAMLGTTVFASGMLSDLAAVEEEYNGTIIVNGAEQKIDIQHIDNIRYLNTDSYYIPLRHAFEILGAAVRYDAPRDNVPTVYTTEASEKIFPTYRWDGLEELAVNDSLNYIYGATTGTNQNPIIKIYFDNDTQWFCQPGCEMYSKLNADTLFSWAPPIIIKNNTAYMPIRALAYIMGGDDNVKWNDDAHDTYYEGVLNFDEESLTIDIDTNIDNTNLRIGKIIVDKNNQVVFKSDDLKNPENTINGFFEAFSDSNFALMKNYCTEKCRNTFFGGGYCFGMTRATLQSISKDSDDLRKRGFVVGEWAALVNVTMTPDENSVYEPNQTATSFYLILKQQDGRYLIDEFATGL